MLTTAVLLLMLACGCQLAATVSMGESGVRSSAGSPSGVDASAGKFLPDGISKADKLRAFLECRKECIAKCDRLVYVYSTKKEFCHDCIRQCMIAVLQQARSLGIDFSTQEERMLGDSPHAALTPEERRRRRRRNKLRNGKDRNDRRDRRQRKEQQKLLKNCIVH